MLAVVLILGMVVSVLGFIALLLNLD